MMRSFRYAFVVMLRPFYGFGELKYEGKASKTVAWALAALALIAYFARMMYSGLSFSSFNPREFNLLRQAASTLFPFALFIVGNWAVSTILDGEGTMRQVFYVTCYALLPYVLATAAATLLTHVLTLEESFLISTLEGAGVLWSAFLLFAGLAVMHQYTARRTLWILIVTLIFMVLAIFTLILLASIADKLISYISSVISEIKLRM